MISAEARERLEALAQLCWSNAKECAVSDTDSDASPKDVESWGGIGVGLLHAMAADAPADALALVHRANRKLTHSEQFISVISMLEQSIQA